jgi:hypothetical protein
MHHTRDSSSQGCIIPGMHHPRDASSQGCILPGMHHPRDASSQGRIIPGMHHPGTHSSGLHRHGTTGQIYKNDGTKILRLTYQLDCDQGNCGCSSIEMPKTKVQYCARKLHVCCAFGCTSNCIMHKNRLIGYLYYKRVLIFRNQLVNIVPNMFVFLKNC